jgi:hypothetical protein
MDFKQETMTKTNYTQPICVSHQEQKVTFYCICGYKLCISCLDIHYHENLTFYDYSMLTAYFNKELPLIATILNELDETVKDHSSSIGKDRLAKFKELKNTINTFKDGNISEPEKLISFLKECYRTRLEMLLIQTLHDVSFKKNKDLNNFIQKQERENQKREKKLKIKQLEKKILLDKENHNPNNQAPSPKKILLSKSSYKNSAVKRSGQMSYYGSSQGSKLKNKELPVVSNFVSNLDESSDYTLDEDIGTGTHQQEIEIKKVECLDTVIRKEVDTTRKLSTCDNCNCFFLLNKDQSNNLCSKCRNSEDVYKEKVKLVCVNCRDKFSVEKSDENLRRNKCDICEFNSKNN